MIRDRHNLRTVTNEDGAIVLNTKLGTISTLNVSGRLVWEALERGETKESIVAGLVARTGEPQQRVERDVGEFLDALKEQRMLLG